MVVRKMNEISKQLICNEVLGHADKKGKTNVTDMNKYAKALSVIHKISAIINLYAKPACP